MLLGENETSLVDARHRDFSGGETTSGDSACCNSDDFAVIKDPSTADLAGTC